MTPPTSPTSPTQPWQPSPNKSETKDANTHHHPPNCIGRTKQRQGMLVVVTLLLAAMLCVSTVRFAVVGLLPPQVVATNDMYVVRECSVPWWPPFTGIDCVDTPLLERQ